MVGNLSISCNKLIESISVPLVELDLERKITYVNNAFLKASKQEEENFIGKDKKQIHEALVNGDITVLKEINSKNIVYEEGGEETTENLLAVVYSDGKEVFYLKREDKIFDENKKHCGYVILFFDMTAQIKYEEYLMKARMESERANLAKSNFLASISHDLRTPLNAILGFSELIKEEAFGEIEIKAYKDYARDIHTSGRLLLDIINDLLDLSKVEAGKMQMSETTVVVEKLIDEAIFTAENLSYRDDIKIKSNVDEQASFIKADERMLKQILNNLLSNAIKFSKEGQVDIFVKASINGSEELVLSVSDKGVGISKEDIEKIMQPYAQIDSEFNKKYKGTGLGTTLVKRIAEMHDARIDVQSELEKGSTFSVIFPKQRVIKG